MERHQELSQLQREWKSPTELAMSTPREVELSAGGKVVAALAIALFFGAIASAVGMSYLADRASGERRAIDAGTETDAVITRHWRSGGKDSTRRIAYEFVYQGRRYAGRTSTPRAIWSRLSEGSTIRVRFAPDRPELNHPVEWKVNDMPWWLPSATAAGLIACAGVIVWALKRQLGLLADGRPAAAVITGHKRGQHGTAVTYEFPLLGGGVGKGRGGESRKPLAVGSVLTVIYDRERPKRNAIYPMSMVRVVR